jgi:hypothetical protein
MALCHTQDMQEIFTTHATNRTIKADVLVNCARIGFKP